MYWPWLGQDLRPENFCQLFLCQQSLLQHDIGNVPAAPPSGGILRHKGWRAARVDLPAIAAKQDASVIAPAEIEIE